MKKIALISIILFGLAGCGGDGSTSEDGDSNTAVTAVTDEKLEGTWKGVCFDAGGPPWATISLTFGSGDFTATLTSYSDDTCTTVTMQDTIVTATYIIGANVTVDGSVAGITTATQLDITVVTGPVPGEKSYTIYAISGNKLYPGEETPSNDGTTPGTRPVRLDPDLDEIFTK